MAVSESFYRHVLDQLREVKGFNSKKMFGGIGFFKDGKMFGMIGGDVFRLKVNESNQSQYEMAGMKPYGSEKKGKGMPYWEVPSEVLEDPDKLAKWVNQSIEIANKKT